MRWTVTTWFKHVCAAIVCVFLSQSVQPMAFGLAPPQPASVSTKTRDVQRTLPLNRIETQVSSQIKKVKGQLQKLEVLSNIEDLTLQQVSDAASCEVPDDKQLAVAISPDSQLTPLLSKKREYVKQIRAKREEAGRTWLDWLSSLLVSEAYAQTSDPNLESTPDANTTDPFIVQKAQELGNDPNQIFAFVRDEISYESYREALFLRGRSNGCKKLGGR